MSTRREATPASIRAIRRGNALEVGHLPTYGFGTRSLMPLLEPTAEFEPDSKLVRFDIVVYKG